MATPDSEQRPVTVAIPTFGREQVLVDTVQALLALPVRAAEILLVDQTPRHDSSTEARLAQLVREGRIRWLRLAQPSIPAAMNRALVEASQEIVLFLDDDVRLDPQLVEAHWQANQTQESVLVSGRVIQPWDEGRTFTPDAPFEFAGVRGAWIGEFMAGNFSIRRELALALGGFDENFVRVAYRFEAEFAHRVARAGMRIRFDPAACIHHLKVPSGGTRTYGEHLTTWRPDHAVGAYYHALRTGQVGTFASRPWRAVATRYHLRHPWRMPATLIAELGGMLWAIGLWTRGPRTLPLP